MKPEMVMMVGLPCSGKSTYAIRHYVNYPIISADIHIEAYAKREGMTYNEAFPIMKKEATRKFNEQLNELLSGRNGFVVDRINVSAKGRKELLDKARAAGFTVTVVYVTASDKRYEQNVKSRPEKVVEGTVLQGMRRSLHDDITALYNMVDDPVVTQFITVRNV